MSEPGSPSHPRTPVRSILSFLLSLVMLTGLLVAIPASAMAYNTRPDVEDDEPIPGTDAPDARIVRDDTIDDAAVTDLGDPAWPTEASTEDDLAAPESAEADTPPVPGEEETVAIAPVNTEVFDGWTSPLPGDAPGTGESQGGDSQNTPEPSPAPQDPEPSPSQQEGPPPEAQPSSEPEQARDEPGAAEQEEAAEAAPAGVEPVRSARVEVLDQATAEQAGVTGVLLRLTRTDGAQTTGPVQIGLDYADFAPAFGADYASRLELVALDDCVLDADAAECAPAIDLASDNQPQVMRLNAVAPAAAGEGTLLAAVADSEGETGDYKATELNAASSWDVGLQTGDFNWAYPINVPGTAAGLKPTVGLSYSSGSVDGRTASSNSQTSWIGEGFSYAAGYIERSYKPCADDGQAEGEKTGDQCWSRHNATLSLNGKGGELILDEDGTWRMRSDDGTRIERLTGADNGDNDGEHWKVTTTDGTQYFFGRNRLPGWESGDPETDSAWTVPVYGNDSGEPCHESTFAASWCQQAYKWNLDYVVDVHGNVVTYHYAEERNHYGRNLKTTATPYVRGGYLTHIDYGLRSDDVYATAPARVKFTVGERCLPTDGFDCAPSKFTEANASKWPDVPFDQHCAVGTPCTNRFSPTFWTRKKLDKVTTQVHDGTAYTDVDSWALEHKYPAPGDGTTPSLWLNSVTHTGHVGGTATSPKVTFAGTALENRVDGLSDGLAPMLKYRITSVYTETGGQVDITYSGEDCARGSTPKPHDNGKRCYPVRWTPEGDAELTDWFHKYVVTQVAEIDLVTDQPDMVTTYEYLGGGAWRYEEADGFTKDKYRTWSDWRGYERVKVISGAPGEQQSETEHLFFRGMHGDKQPSGTRSVTVTDSEGGIHTDHDELNGATREEIIRNGPGGAVVEKTITTPWRKKTAERDYSWGTVSAYLIDTASSRTYTAVDDGWRQTRVDTAFDDYGFPTQVHDYGDAALDTDDECTRTTYTRDTSAWILDTTSREEVVAASCAQAPERPADVISDSRTFYDGGAFGAAPTRGLPTTTERLASYDGTTPVYETSEQTAYDAYGRETSSTNAAGHTTRTGYESAVPGGAPTVVTDENALGHTATQYMDPARSMLVATVDANKNRTDLQYDPLGRLTAVWLADRDKSTATPSLKFEYRVRNDAPTTVVASAVRNDGGYNSTFTLYDAFLRERQIQSPAVGGEGRLVADTFHDSRGLAVKSREAYFNAAAEPGDTLLVVNNDDEIPRYSETVYDGAERPTVVRHVSRGEEQWSTTTEYRGDRTLVTPPDGDTATTTITDARDRVVELRQHHAPTPTGAFDATTYTYAKNGELATVTDPAGNVWETTYDLRGRKIQAVDPDAGTSTYTYDALDQLATSTDGRGETVAYTYDVLGRKTGLYDDSPQGTQRAGWVYDTRAKGQLTSSTRYTDDGDYTNAVLSYDKMYRPLAETVTIPASEGPLAGTYRYIRSYNPDGTVKDMAFPRAGGLSAEPVTFGYNELGMPTTVKGINTYVAEAIYSRTGNLLQRTFLRGSTADETWITRVFDEATNRMSLTSVVPEVGSGSLLTQSYEYDDAGNILRIADKPTGLELPTDTQCFTYDHLRRLTNAWTPESTETGGCEAAPTTAGLGGAAPYWHSYTYDAVGNRETEVQHAAGGDITRTYTQPEPGQDQPHAVTRVEQTGPGGDQLEQYGYDDAGNLTSRVTPAYDQTLEWDAEGKLVRVTDGDAQTEFRYGADGSRLVRETPTDATLYLPGMEVRMDKAAFSLEATRFYDHGGEGVAVRENDNKLSWLFADHHGTGELSVDSETGESTRRRFTAFGTDRGSSGEWPSQRGFVGGTLDTSVGLTQLGARAYDAAIGRFVSPDPVVDFTDPQQIHGYAYSGNNPVTFTDPTGLLTKKFGGRPTKMGGGRFKTKNRGRGPKSAAGGGGGGGYSGGGGSGGGSYRPSAGNAVYQGIQGANAAFNRVPFASQYRDSQAGAVVALMEMSPMGWAGNYALQHTTGMGFADSLRLFGVNQDSGWYTSGYVGAYIASMITPGGWGAGGIRAAVLGGKAALKLGGLKGLGAFAANGARSAGSYAANAVRNGWQSAGNAIRGCAGNSFVPGTRVVMANGGSKAIEDVEVGDTVLATDPDTGNSEAKPVLATITGSGNKHLVEITVDTTTEKPAGEDGNGEGAPGPVVFGDEIVATGGHPFWVPEKNEWVDASDLTPGMWLLTISNSWVQVTAVRIWSQNSTVHNLTVDDINTYNIRLNDSSVLVHNRNKVCGLRLSDPNPIPRVIREQYEEIRAGRGTPRPDGVGGQQVYQGRELLSRQRAQWSGSLEWDVPGTSHRILQRLDGNLGYVLNHDYSSPFLFPAPWYPEGGAIPRRL
ncbi:RHS repeat-associated core domain-containing protein [Actinorugispora endophytica]|uniref:RHS repeat-associated protein n=1 Tax=Actinorugispora endophytica TaxID=1605990 RepID=A0A4R6V0L5_9ACTN|nr:RHS repeat-associated core domain-containing protein [Actinorugispora endophytica]TDQ53342.1 RHS repeat-associated protein [Actinorugispora endophytica]